MTKCIICGKEIEKSQYSNADLCSGKCFHENFWNETLDDSAIIINGECYHDGGYRLNHCGFLGCAGRVFKIQMNSGEIITTNNLWCNGEVPKERNIPDNARFINNEPKISPEELII